MAIISYTPPNDKVVDHRNENGGYYTAKCDKCGTEFYPKKSNAKYCTPNCAVISHRKAKAEILAAGGTIDAKTTSKTGKKRGRKPKRVSNIDPEIQKSILELRKLRIEMKAKIAFAEKNNLAEPQLIEKLAELEEALSHLENEF